MDQTPISSIDFSSECLCLGLQKAARAIARRYDFGFRAFGITSGQFSILAGLASSGSLPLTSLARSLGMDRSTLTRNLRPLEAEKLLSVLVESPDRRIRTIALTPQGRARFEQALPAWLALQTDGKQRLAPTRWPDIGRHLQALA